MKILPLKNYYTLVSKKKKISFKKKIFLKKKEYKSELNKKLDMKKSFIFWFFTEEGKKKRIEYEEQNKDILKKKWEKIIAHKKLKKEADYIWYSRIYDQRKNYLSKLYKKIWLGTNFINAHVKESKKKETDEYKDKEKNTNFKKDLFEKIPFFLKKLKKAYTTKFKFVNSLGYVLKTVNLFMLEMGFFIKYNIYLGFSKTLTNNRNNNYLLGYYSKIAIINVKYLLINFKANITAISKMYIKKYMSGFVINEIYNDLMAKGYIHILDYFEMGYFFGNWWKGFLKNFKIFLYHSSVAYKEFNFYKRRYPGFVFFLGVPDLSCHTSLYYLNKEVCSLKMFSMMFFDTKHSTQNIIWPILSNNKNYSYNLFYVKIIMCIFTRIDFFRKKYFFDDKINLNFKYFLNRNFEEEDDEDFIINNEIFFNFLYSDMMFLMFKKKKLDKVCKKLIY